MTWSRRKPRRRKPKATVVQRDGGLALTFVNTTSGQRPSLESYADLLAFTLRHGQVSPVVAEALEGLAEKQPEDAEAVFQESRDVLAALSRIFNALAARQKRPKDAVQVLNAFFLKAYPARYLSGIDDYYQWTLSTSAAKDLRWPLWLVLSSAGKILTSRQDCRRVKRCAAEDCDTLFVARNSGRPRKWCTESCGSRTTSRTHYDKNVRPRRERMKKKAREAGEKNVHDTLIYQHNEIKRLRDEIKQLTDEES